MIGQTNTQTEIPSLDNNNDNNNNNNNNTNNNANDNNNIYFIDIYI